MTSWAAGSIPPEPSCVAVLSAPRSCSLPGHGSESDVYFGFVLGCRACVHQVRSWGDRCASTSWGAYRVCFRARIDTLGFEVCLHAEFGVGSQNLPKSSEFARLMSCIQFGLLHAVASLSVVIPCRMALLAQWSACEPFGLSMLRVPPSAVLRLHLQSSSEAN